MGKSLKQRRRSDRCFMQIILNSWFIVTLLLMLIYYLHKLFCLQILMSCDRFKKEKKDMGFIFLNVADCAV